MDADPVEPEHLAAPELEAAVDATEHPAPSRTAVTAVVAAVAVLVIASNVGQALTTTWADRHPLALIALNSRNAILVLTTNQLDAWSYYGVASLRLLVSDPLFFLIGMWYGDRAIAWVEKQWASQGRVLRWFESAFTKAAYPLVFLAPNNPICLLAGATGMRLRVFVALNVSGTLARLWAIRVLGETFEAPIDDVLGFFARYRVPLLVASVGLVALSVWSDRRSGRGDFEVITELEHELDEGEGG